MPSRKALLILTLLGLATLSTSSCGFETIDDATCPTGGTSLTYANFGQGFFARHCNSCHSAPLGKRNGAPDNQVFETLEQVRFHKDRIFVRSAGDNDSMPPGPDDPPIDERKKLAEWLVCGAP